MRARTIYSIIAAILIAHPALCHARIKIDTRPTEWVAVEGIAKNQNFGELQDIDSVNLPMMKGQRNIDIQRTPCQIVQIVHLLKHPGCQSKAIESFACSGTCSSYVQMSASRFWQHERSCSCCQQTGLQEATFTLDCPPLSPPYKKIKTYSPVDCMCRACTDLGKENLQPQELVEALSGESNNESKF